MIRISILYWQRTWVAFIAGMLVALQPLMADDSDISQFQIQQATNQQADLRNHTKQVVAKVQSMISDLESNGVSGKDIKVLEATKAILSNLSEREMDRVIASLKSASVATNQGDVKKGVTEAYAVQQGIVIQFLQILKDYQSRQAQNDLPVRFMDLCKRQGATLQTTSEVAGAMVGKSLSALASTQQTLIQVLQSDQEALSSEVALAVEELAKVAEQASGANGKALQAALKSAKDGQVEQIVSKASEELKGGMLLKATNDQKNVRDQLRQIIQLMDSSLDAVQAIQKQLAAIGELIKEQNQLMDKSVSAIDSKPPVRDLDTKQGALVDEADSIQQDVRVVSTEASDLVKQAEDPMQVSRLNLAQLRKESLEKAVDSQKAALSKLEDARALLSTQLVAAQKAKEDAKKDTAEKLQDLQQEILATQKKEQQLAQQTNQALNATTPDPQSVAQAQQQQMQLQKQAAGLQQESQALSMEVAQALTNAAQAMQDAQNNLASPVKQQNAPANQQAALAALDQALSQLKQQLADLQQQQATPDALNAANDDLQKAETALADAKPDQAKQDLQDAANVAGLPDAAEAAIKSAQTDLANGQQQAAQQDIAQAQAAIALAAAGMDTTTQTADSGSGTDPSSTSDGSSAPSGQSQPGSVPSATGMGPGGADGGNMHNVSGSGKFVALAARDRAAIQQSQTEKRPQEYATYIDQYMKNLADEASSTPQ